ncbi:hypothetical protein [Candidatus Halobonum tyrrellensis]|uniref:hypothetical protein n=1 Tax=Candidatus Halobonum tyrrellensis TaxID=1431545 RepID=UPI000677B952|nr:hypothetical protein [Candidatus Halobonum tyrrellensis]
MSDDRATVRPITLARLVETAYVCQSEAYSTTDIEERLDVSHRRARSVLLEALRIGLLDGSDDAYTTTGTGSSFVDATTAQNWSQVNSILESGSPHYAMFLDVVREIGPARLETVLDALERNAEPSSYTYNQASVEVLGDWAERLETVQRNAFTGEYYYPTENKQLADFAEILLGTLDDLEETTGAGMRQRYLSIPEVRETFCAHQQISRETFDRALETLAQQNVGRLELSGAPMDTSAKEASYGIKEIALADGDELVSTSQSTDKVMQGVEQYGKQYYYLTIHDRNLTYDHE